MADPVDNRPKQDGRFQPGQSGNPLGRPRGAYNRGTQLARLLLGRSAGRLVQKCIEMAVAGDGIALRLCIERLAPIPRTGTVRIDLPQVRAVADVAVAMNAVTEAVTSGMISLDDGERLIGLLDRQRVALEQPDIELRVKELEAQIREIGLAQVARSHDVARPNGRSV